LPPHVTDIFSRPRLAGGLPRNNATPIPIPNGALKIPKEITVSPSSAATLTFIQNVLQYWLDNFSLGSLYGCSNDALVEIYDSIIKVAVSDLRNGNATGYLTLRRNLNRHSEAIQAAAPVSQFLDSQISQCSDPVLQNYLSTRFTDVQFTVRCLQLLVYNLEAEVHQLIQRQDDAFVTQILTKVCLSCAFIMINFRSPFQQLI
jgi:hypothetical protein